MLCFGLKSESILFLFFSMRKQYKKKIKNKIKICEHIQLTRAAKKFSVKI